MGGSEVQCFVWQDKKAVSFINTISDPTKVKLRWNSGYGALSRYIHVAGDPRKYCQCSYYPIWKKLPSKNMDDLLWSMEVTQSCTFSEQHLPVNRCSTSGQRQRTSYGCKRMQSDISPLPLCITPCLCIHHTKQ